MAEARGLDTIQRHRGEDFTEAERTGVYNAIYKRRDIRSFRSDPVPDDLLWRILDAAHHAPSVGYMQPWNFVVIRSAETKAKLGALADREVQALGLYYDGDRGALYRRLKVEGLREAPVTVCVTNDPSRGGPHVLGRNSIPETDAYSVACAVQNLWLAARAEGLGVGWVSFYRKPDVRAVLGLPAHIDPVALLCIGYTDWFTDQPLLEVAGWNQRGDLTKLVFSERWEQPYRR